MPPNRLLVLSVYCSELLYQLKATHPKRTTSHSICRLRASSGKNTTNGTCSDASKVEVVWNCGAPLVIGLGGEVDEERPLVTAG